MVLKHTRRECSKNRRYWSWVISGGAFLIVVCSRTFQLWKTANQLQNKFEHDPSQPQQKEPLHSHLEEHIKSSAREENRDNYLDVNSENSAPESTETIGAEAKSESTNRTTVKFTSEVAPYWKSNKASSVNAVGDFGLPLPLPANYTPYLPTSSESHTDYFRDEVDRDFDASSLNTFCLPWDVNSDEWWVHHPTWTMGAENDTHYCFEKMRSTYTRQIMEKLYKIQFHGDCSKSKTKRQWNSGWAASSMNVVDGLTHAYNQQMPVQFVEGRWHYADPAVKPTKENRKVPPACPRRNMFCYFLPVSNCPPAPQGRKAGFLEAKQRYPHYDMFYAYFTRPQTWLRKAIYDFVKQQEENIPMKSPCAVMHVRRGDALLDTKKHKREYHPISTYIDVTKGAIHKNILLLSDDQNAITEAKIEHGDRYNWMYIDRPRYKGTEGGWEKHLPSNNPEFEVTVLLGTVKLAAKHCTQLVRSTSGFANIIQRGMGAPQVFNIDENKARSKVYNVKNAKTVDVSEKYSNITIML